MSALDLSSTVAAFAVDNLVRKREATGSYVSGEYVAGAVTETSFTASVQPISGQLRQALASGLRTRDLRELYTLQQLRPAPQGDAGDPGDVVAFDGSDWDVVSSQAWTGHGKFFRAAIARIQVS